MSGTKRGYSLLDHYKKVVGNVVLESHLHLSYLNSLLVDMAQHAGAEDQDAFNAVRCELETALDVARDFFCLDRNGEPIEGDGNDEPTEEDRNGEPIEEDDDDGKMH